MKKSAMLKQQTALYGKEMEQIIKDIIEEQKELSNDKEFLNELRNHLI